MPAKVKQQSDKERRKPNSQQRQPEAKSPVRKYAMAVFSAVVVVLVVVGLYYLLIGALPANFNTFRSNFNAAPRVALLVTAYNGTQLSGAIGCASSLIQQMVASQSQHRNASTIDYYVLNQTECVYSTTGLGSLLKNYTYATPANCISMSSGEPRIFINYSEVNNTRITSTSLSYSGNIKFLLQCGIASEMTAG